MPMRPVERSDHNFTFIGNGEDVGNLSCFKDEDGAVVSHWRPSPEEIAVLEAGGDVELRIFADPIPPVNVGIAANDQGSEAAEGYELVEIDGVPHRVPTAIAFEMAKLVEGIIGEIKNFRPEPGATIVITTPAQASHDFTEMVLHQASRQFEDYRVSVMPESLGLHTSDGLAQLLAHGTAMAEAIQEGDPARIEAAAGRWSTMLGEKETPPDGN